MRQKGTLTNSFGPNRRVSRTSAMGAMPEVAGPGPIGANYRFVFARVGCVAGPSMVRVMPEMGLEPLSG
jgi:hypothetical protein